MAVVPLEMAMMYVAILVSIKENMWDCWSALQLGSMLAYL